MKFSSFSRLMTFLSGCFLSQVSHAAAFQFYELGAPINGTAGVGQAAITTDASTAYYNPAGMTALPSTELLLGTQMILPYNNFSPNSLTTITGTNGGNAGSLLPGADGYFVYHYSPNIAVGFSLTAPYGGALNYNDHWVGRYSVQQMLLYTLNFNPAIAYQVTDWFSLGGGVSVEYANLYQSVALPLIPSVLDGQATLKVDSTSPGFNVGILLKPSNDTKIGVAFRSQIVHHLSGKINFFNIGLAPNATTKMVMPANVIASFSQNVTNQFSLLAEAGWSHWSSMVNTIIHVSNFSAVNQQNWHDTYRLGLAGQYHATPGFLLETGVSYDSSPTSAGRRLPDLPMDKQIRFGVGLEYALLTAVKLGASYEYLNLGRAQINNTSFGGVLAGSYSRNFANFFQVSLNVEC